MENDYARRCLLARGPGALRLSSRALQGGGHEKLSSRRGVPMSDRNTPDPERMKLALKNIVRAYRRGELTTWDEDLAAYIDLTIPEIICEEVDE